MMIFLLFIYQFITMATQYRTSDRFELWSTNTAGSGNPFSILQMRNDGNLVISRIEAKYEQLGHRFSTIGLPLYKKKIALVTKPAKSFLDGDGGLSESNASDMGLVGDPGLGIVNIVAEFLGAGMIFSRPLSLHQ
jgi:hypothetical protein